MYMMNLIALTPKFLLPYVGALLTVDFEGILKSSESADTSALDDIIDKTEGVGWSVNRLIVTGVLIAMVIGGVIAAAKLFFATPQERQEQKTGLLWKALAVIGVAAVPALILVLTGVGKNLFG